MNTDLVNTTLNYIQLFYGNGLLFFVFSAIIVIFIRRFFSVKKETIIVLNTKRIAQEYKKKLDEESKINNKP
jgi:hypothetical protein